MILAETLVDADDVVGIVGDYVVDGAIPMQVSMSDAKVAEAGADARQVSMSDAEMPSSFPMPRRQMQWRMPRSQKQVPIPRQVLMPRQVSMSDSEMPMPLGRCRYRMLYPGSRLQVLMPLGRCRGRTSFLAFLMVA